MYGRVHRLQTEGAIETPRGASETHQRSSMTLSAFTRTFQRMKMTVLRAVTVGAYCKPLS